MKRSILIEGIKKELDIKKFNVVKTNTDSEFIYLEKMKDGTWRFTVTEKTIPDMKKVTGFKIIREN